MRNDTLVPMAISEPGVISRESPAALAALVETVGWPVPAWAGMPASGRLAGAFKRGPGGRSEPGGGRGAGASAGGCGLVDGPAVGASRMVTPRDLPSARAEDGMPAASAPATTTGPRRRRLVGRRMGCLRVQ